MRLVGVARRDRILGDLLTAIHRFQRRERARKSTRRPKRSSTVEWSHAEKEFEQKRAMHYKGEFQRAIHEAEEQDKAESAKKK